MLIRFSSARGAAGVALLAGAFGCGARSALLLGSGERGAAGSVGASGAVGSAGSLQGSAGTGGTVHVAGSSGAAGSAGTAGSSGMDTVPLPGSYNLRLFDAMVSPASSFPVPAEGAELRVDLNLYPQEDLFSGVGATITPRWGDPTAFRAPDLAGGPLGSTLNLEGSTTIVSPDTNIRDSFDFFSFQTSCASTGCNPADGRLILGDTVGGSGNEAIPEGSGGTLMSQGDLELDTLAPELKSLTVSTNGPADVLLPWDPLTVRAAEPVPQSALAAALSVQKGGERLPTSFTFTPNDGQTVLATGRLSSWTGFLSGGDATLIVSPASSIADPSGNVLASDLNAPLQFIDLGSEHALVTFANMGEVGSWGETRWLGMTMSGPCEFCMQLGPVDLGYCGVPRTGIAGLLDVNMPASSVRIAYRVLTDTNANPTSGGAFSVELALPGGTPLVTPVSMPALTPLSGAEAGLLGMHYGSADLSVDIPLPSGLSVPGQVGYAVFFPGIGTCGGGPAIMPVRTTVLIDQIGTD